MVHRFILAVARRKATWLSCAVFATMAALQATAALAQLPGTELTSIFPPGCVVGTSVEVQTNGANEDEAVRLVFSHPGITAQVKTAARNEFLPDPQPLPGQFTVTVAGDVPPGIYDARVVGRFGASNPRSFVVGTANELVDDGTNHQASAAKELPIPSTVNGLADANMDDFYKLKLKQGQRVLIECAAQCIDSRMDSTLVLSDAQGHELARNLQMDGSDAVLDFTAPQDGEYLLTVWDFFYDGGADYFYRLHVHTDSRIDFVFPPSGLAGSNLPLAVYGRNLPNAKPSNYVGIDGVHLDVLQTSIAIPSQPDVLGVETYLQPQQAVVDAIPYRVGNSSPVMIGIAKAPVAMEAEPNNSLESPQPITAPCEVAGQFYPANDLDCFQFDAKKGETYVVEVLAHRSGNNCDPSLLIERLTRDGDGKVTASTIAQVDDPQNRPNAIGSSFDTTTDDPSFQFTADADATYRVAVRDQFGDSRADPRMTYRLAIRPLQPDFRLHAVPQEIKTANANEIRLTSLNLRRGSTSLLRVRAERFDGFNQEVRLDVEGLPAGVTCPTTILGPLQDTAWLVFTAAEDAAEWAGPIRILGKSQVNGAEVVRTARTGAVTWGTANNQEQRAEFRLARNLFLAVLPETSAALVKLSADNVLETSRGGVIEVPIQLARRDGFAEAVKLVASNLPDVVKPADVDIAADKSDGKLTISIANANAQPGIYNFYLRSDTKIKYSRNPEAIARAEAEVKKLADVITQIVEQVKQATAARDTAVQQAQTAAAEMTTATQAQTTATQAVEQADVALKQATDKLTAAQQAAAQNTGDQALTDAVAAAQKEVEAATTNKNAATENGAKASQALADATAKAKAAEEAKTAMEASLTQMEERAKRANDTKGAEDKRVEEIEKASQPADVQVALVSTPIQLRIVSSPIQLSAAAPAVSVKRAEKGELNMNLQRLYGFADAVELTVELPNGVSGLAVEKVAVPADQTAGKLVISADANTPAGEYTLTIHAKAKFNNVDVESKMPVTLKVE